MLYPGQSLAPDLDMPLLKASPTLWQPSTVSSCRRVVPDRRVLSLQRNLASSRQVAARNMTASVTAAGATETAPHVYSMGPGTLRVDRKKLHGTIRANFLAAFQKALADNGAAAAGVVLIQGGEAFHVYSTDGELVFKQEAYMHYLFGVTEDGWYGALDMNTGKAHLFMPRLPDAYAVWMGRLKTTQEYQQIYAVDEVHYVDELSDVLKSLLASHKGSQQQRAGEASGRPGPLYVLHGKNTDSDRDVPGATFDGIKDFDTDTHNSTTLFNVLTECRVHKTAEEIAIQQYVNRIGALGHVAMMQAAAEHFRHHPLGFTQASDKDKKPSALMEYHLESLFLHTCYSQGGCRLAGYTPISASGPNGAVLHYGHAGAPNDRQVHSGEMVLVDMGCEYYRYTSDITCTWPSNGKFTAEQKLIYETVLEAHQAVIAAMKPGVSWPDMHTLTYRVLLTGLKTGGLLQGEVDDMLKDDIGALFMPHGLGHFLGIDTHDVGGYLPGCPPRITRPGYKSLRTARKLTSAMVITVEPGCYFTEALIGPALQLLLLRARDQAYSCALLSETVTDPLKSKYLVADNLKSFMQFGGVRLEDNVLVTDTGAESMTDVPRTVEDIEAVMAGAAWPRS